MLADDIIHARNVICAAWHPGMVTNGYDVNTYTRRVERDHRLDGPKTSAAVGQRHAGPDTLDVTGDADRLPAGGHSYGDKADYITWDIAATGIYDQRDGDTTLWHQDNNGDRLGVKCMEASPPATEQSARFSGAAWPSLFLRCDDRLPARRIPGWVGAPLDDRG